MCEQCKPFDDELDHYRQLKSRLTDQQTLEGIAQLIMKLEAQKTALHPEV